MARATLRVATGVTLIKTEEQSGYPTNISYVCFLYNTARLKTTYVESLTFFTLLIYYNFHQGSRSSGVLVAVAIFLDLKCCRFWQLCGGMDDVRTRKTHCGQVVRAIHRYFKVRSVCPCDECRGELFLRVVSFSVRGKQKGWNSPPPPRVPCLFRFKGPRSSSRVSRRRSRRRRRNLPATAGIIENRRNSMRSKQNYGPAVASKVVRNEIGISIR